MKSRAAYMIAFFIMQFVSFMIPIAGLILGIVFIIKNQITVGSAMIGWAFFGYILGLLELNAFLNFLI